MKKGFVLVTALMIIALVSFLTFMQLAYINVLQKQVENHYKRVQAGYNLKTQQAYQKWLSLQH